MAPTPTELTSKAELEQALADGRGPVLLFKHSPTCGTSALAYEDLLEAMAADRVAAPVYLIHVRRHREISDAVAARFKLRHESPQAILVRDGRVLWSASHHGAHADAIIAQVRNALAA
jgi:bacillithiol system protein YtxJ